MNSYQKEIIKIISMNPNMMVNEERKGRNAFEGTMRGWNIEYGNIQAIVEEDPVFNECYTIAKNYSLIEKKKIINIYLIILAKCEYINTKDIIEFGVFRGGGLLFIGLISKFLKMNSSIYGIDSFEGMPKSSVDKRIDMHSVLDFNYDNRNVIENILKENKLSNVYLIKSEFSHFKPKFIKRIGLVHLDADLYNSCIDAFSSIKYKLSNKCYIILDDTNCSSTLGAAEFAEDYLIRKYHLNCEQRFPHEVYRFNLKFWKKPITFILNNMTNLK